jgi:biotin carboxylase
MSGPIVVLSTLSTSLERELAARGRAVIVLVPRAVVHERARPDCAVRGVDRWDDYTELARLAADLERQGVVAVATTDERCLRAAAFLRAVLGLPGLGFDDAVAFTDKAVMKARLRAHGVAVAEGEVVHAVDDLPDVAARLGWPLLVKPRSGFSAISTHVIRDPAHLAQLRADGVLRRGPSIGTRHPALSATDGLGPLGSSPRGFLTEACVDVHVEFQCELLRRGGEEVYCLPFRYSAPLLQAGDRVGAAHIGSSSEDARRVREITRSAADALGLRDGFAHAEVFRLRDGTWLLGEIGARPGGAQTPRIMALQHGIDVVAQAADLVEGITTPLAVEEADQSTAWVSIPAPTGIVTAMTPVEELRALPGVVDVVMEIAVGDTSTGPLGSLAHAGYVFCAAATTERALALAASAAASCVIETTGSEVTAHA